MKGEGEFSDSTCRGSSARTAHRAPSKKFDQLEARAWQQRHLRCGRATRRRVRPPKIRRLGTGLILKRVFCSVAPDYPCPPQARLRARADASHFRSSPAAYGRHAPSQTSAEPTCATWRRSWAIRVSQQPLARYAETFGQPAAVTIIASRVGLRGQGMASRVRVNAQTYSTIGRSPGRL